MTGLDWTGLDWTGHWTGLDWTGLDWTGLERIFTLDAPPTTHPQLDKDKSGTLDPREISSYLTPDEQLTAEKAEAAWKLATHVSE